MQEHLKIVWHELIPVNSYKNITNADSFLWEFTKH